MPKVVKESRLPQSCPAVPYTGKSHLPSPPPVQEQATHVPGGRALVFPINMESPYAGPRAITPVSTGPMTIRDASSFASDPIILDKQSFDSVAVTEMPSPISTGTRFSFFNECSHESNSPKAVGPRVI